MEPPRHHVAAQSRPATSGEPWSGCRSVAFTLVELLVVISIIALLIGILMPALRHARVAAQAMQSTSNLRQIAIALHAYAEDNDWSLPYGRLNGPPSDPWDDPPWETWAYHLRDRGAYTGYIEGYQVFWGPGRDLAWAEQHYDGNHNFLRPGYAAYYDSTMPLQSSGMKPLQLGAGNTPQPSEHLLLVEAFDSSFFSSGNDGIWGIEPDLSADHGFGTNGYYLFTYNGGAPRVYMDGHASASNSEDIGWRSKGPRDGEWLLWPATAFEEEPWFERD